MAIIECKSCGRKISDKSPSCPHCDKAKAKQLSKGVQPRNSHVEAAGVVLAIASSAWLAFFLLFTARSALSTLIIILLACLASIGIYMARRRIRERLTNFLFPGRLTAGKEVPALFSASRLELFDKCPFAFFQEYVNGEQATFRSVEAHLGNSVHKAIEFAYAERQSGEAVTLKRMLDFFESAWKDPSHPRVKVIKSKQQEADYYEEGVSMLRGFYNKKFSKDKDKTIALEKEFSYTLPDGSTYRGIIDRISEDPKGMVSITDYKTGKNVGYPQESRQLLSYAMWALDTYDTDKVKVCIEVLRTATTRSHVLERNFGKAIEKDLVDEISKIRSTKVFQKKPSVLCKWCGHQHHCRNQYLAK